ncbi:MAG: DUF4625 domain-containing protein [Crocinitomicaceae bacterium]|jgi:hypothetical protein|nr:DUF4625 domain-containing protein [Crocinitomicaceae bacterium]
MKSILNIAFASTILFTFVSCKKDKENPTILIAEPINHSEHLWGSEVHIEATFADDRDLKSYHIHMGTEAGDHTPEFNIEFTGDISGKSYDFHEHFMVPDSIEHVYYLHFEVTDAEGKSTEAKLMLHFMQ